MSPMVQHQQLELNRQSQPKDKDSETEDSCDVIHHRSRRPLYRRFFNYVREAWTGVKFALGKLAR